MPSLLSTGSLGVIGALAPAIGDTFGISYAAIGSAFILQIIGGLSAAFVIGASRARVVEPLPLAVLATAALTIAGLAPVYAVFLGAMVVTGIAGYGLTTRAQADVSQRAAGGRRDRALSAFHTWGGFGSFAFPLAFAAVLAIGLSWRVGFVLLAAAYAGYGLAVRRTAPPRAGPRPAQRSLPPAAKWALVIPVVGIGIQVTVPLWLALIMVDEFHGSEAVGTIAVTTYFFSLFAARAGGTRLLAVISERFELYLSGGLMLVGFAVLGAASAAPTLLAAAVLIGAGVGQMLPLGVARLTHLTADDRGSSSLVMTLGGIVQIAFPATIVVLLRFLELRTALTLVAAGAVVILMAVRASEARPAAPSVAR